MILTEDLLVANEVDDDTMLVWSVENVVDVINLISPQFCLFTSVLAVGSFFTLRGEGWRLFFLFSAIICSLDR